MEKKITAEMMVMLGPNFWPTVRRGIEKLGSLGAMRVGPGLYGLLKKQGAAGEGSVVEMVSSQEDRDVFLVDAEGHEAVRLIVGFAEPLTVRKRGASHPRCDLVSNAGGDMSAWREWMRQFPVVATVGKRRSRKLANEEGVTADLYVGSKPREIPQGFTAI